MIGAQTLKSGVFQPGSPPVIWVIHQRKGKREGGRCEGNVRLAKEGHGGVLLAGGHLTDGKMQLWFDASMFLEDASSFYIQHNLSGLFKMNQTMALSQPRRSWARSESWLRRSDVSSRPSSLLI